MQYVDADGVAHTGTVLEFDPNGYSIVQFDNPPTGKKLIDSYTEADLDAMTGRESNSSEAAAEAPSTENASSPIVEENGMDIFNMPDAAPSSPAPATDSNTTSKPSPKPSAPAAPQQRAIDRIPVDEKGNHVFEHAPVEDTAQAFLERANGDVDKAIQTAQFWRNKLNSKVKDARAKAENAESPEAYMDTLNSIQTMEENVKYWEDVVKYLEGVKNGAEVQAEAEAQAEAGVPEATEEARAEETAEEAPVTENEGQDAESNPNSENVGETESDTSENSEEEPKPIGQGVFGNIYNQFKGKVKAAFDFLMKNKSGDLLSVFHREDIGDIDLVWGDRGGGLAHMIRRHLEEQNDFVDVAELCDVIDNVIKHGTIVRENADKVNIEYDGYRVSIRKTIRDKEGNIVSNKNWIVTAFDKSKPKHEKRRKSSSETLSTPSTNREADGVTLPSNDIPSTDKGTESAEPVQENEEENNSEETPTNDRHSERENTEEPSETESKPKPKEEKKLTEEERNKLAEEKRKADQKKLAAWREARLNAIRSAYPKESEQWVNAIDKLMRLQYLPEDRKKAFEELAKSLGYEVKFVGADQLVENGTININGKVITIAMDSENAVTATFGHELTHAIRAVSAEQYKKLLTTAKSLMKSESKWNHALMEYAERYKDLKKADEVEEELVADVIGQLVNSRNFVESFMPHADAETRSVIGDYINRFATALKGALSKVGIKVKEGEKPKAKNEIEKKLDEAQKAVRDAIIGAQSANKENSQNDAESNGISSVTDAAEATLAQDGEGRSSMRTEQMDGEVKRSERIVTPEMDQAYMDAVDKGDMETAQRMVNEAAEKAGYKIGSDYQGTSAYNGAAPWGNGYFLTREERKDAWDNGEFEGEQTLGDYISDGIDGGNLETLTNDASMRAADKMRKEAIRNVRSAIQRKAKIIKMYGAQNETYMVG